MIFIEKKFLSILQTPRKCRNTLLYNSINSPWDLGHMGIKKRHFQALNQHGTMGKGTMYSPFFDSHMAQNPMDYGYFKL